jgi:hypothetical protein
MKRGCGGTNDRSCGEKAALQESFRRTVMGASGVTGCARRSDLSQTSMNGRTGVAVEYHTKPQKKRKKISDHNLAC